MCVQAQASVEARGPLRALFLRCYAPFYFLSWSPLLSWNFPSRIGCVTPGLVPGICLSPACHSLGHSLLGVLGIEVAASTLLTELFPGSACFFRIWNYQTERAWDTQ